VSLAPLASVDDLAAVLGEDCIAANDPRAAAALNAASALARMIARQTLSKVEGDVVELQTSGPELYLPERPVLDVAEIDLDDCWYADPILAPGSYCWSENGLVRGPFSFNGRVRVTYSHGYDPVPDDVRYAVADIAARRYSGGVSAGLLASESIGTYSYSFRPPDGAYGLSSAESAVFKRYRVPTTSIRTPSLVADEYAYASSGWWDC
jgi:hypothetical protein